MGIKSCGTFVMLDSGTIGLIHASETKTGYTENIYRLLSVGGKVLVQVVDFDEFTQKASLSLCTLEEEKHHLHCRHRFSNSHLNIGFQPLADSLPKRTKENLELLAKEQ